MKKKTLAFIVLLATFVFTGYEFANACTAEVTCSNGEKIGCYGESECLSGPTWVRCDQNQTSYCNKHHLE